MKIFTQNRRFAMLFFGLVSLALYWLIVNVPQIYFVRYAIDQFYVLWHEGGHSIATVLTRGSVDGLVILPGIGGYAKIAGGDFSSSLPAGYTGAALVGAIMFYITNRYPRNADFFGFVYGVLAILVTGIFWTSDPFVRFLSISVCVFIIGFVAVTRTTKIRWMLTLLIVPTLLAVVISQVSRDSSANLAPFVGLVTGGFLIIIAVSRSEIVNLVILNVLNIALMVNAWVRVAGLPESTFLGSRDDAGIFAGIYGGEPHDIALRWLITCLIFFGVSIVATYISLGEKKKV